MVFFREEEEQTIHSSSTKEEKIHYVSTKGGENTSLLYRG